MTFRGGGAVRQLWAVRSAGVDAGKVLLERKIEAEPAAIDALLRSFGQPFKRVGLEAGPTSSWLYGELRASGYPVICLECRHVKAGLSAMRNKTDRNDARGIAQLLRLGWFGLVYIKSEEAQRVRMLLVNRQQLLTKAQDFENSVNKPRAPSTSSASSMRARQNVRGKDRGTIMVYNLTFRDQSKNVRAARIYAGMISRER